MNIQKKITEKETVLELEGWLDTQSAPMLQKELEELEEGTENLVLDFTKLEYISSAGLRQVVAAHKLMKGSLTLRGVSQEIMDIMHMSGFDKRLRIE